MHSLAGHNLGPYRLIEQVGVGGMSFIYRAYDPSLDRYVAIKLLPEYLSHDPEFSARFRAEARNVARLRHPNIVPIYSYGEEAGLSYFVMELVEGGTLKTLMNGLMPLARTVHLIGQVADALQYAHEQGIVHRDVKPGNVLLPRPNWALLSDFGIARVLEGSEALTHGGSAFLGTPQYMAPEQARGERVSPATDQYALGIVLYEMLTGTAPFRADTPQAVVYQHIYSSLPLPRERNPALPESMERVILKALAKEPEDRFTDMAAFAAAMRAAAPGQEAPQPAVDVSSTVELPRSTSPTHTPDEPPPAATQHIEPAALAAAVQPVRAEAAPLPPRHPRTIPLTRRGMWGLGALGVAGAVLAGLALTRPLGTSSAGAEPVRIAAAPFMAPLPDLSITDAHGSTVKTVPSPGRAVQLSLPPGRYALQFPSDSRYRMPAPFVVRSGQSETIRLAARYTLFRLRASHGTLPGVQVNGMDGAGITNVSSSDTRTGIWLLNGRYRVQFASGSGYLGSLLVALRGAQRPPIDLSVRMASVRIVPAPHVPLTSVEVDSVAGVYQFDLPTDTLEGTQMWPPGRYLVALNGGNHYLDPLPIHLRERAHVILDLARLYGAVTITPARGTKLPNIEIHDARTGRWLHNVTTFEAQPGMYMLPGRYLLQLSGPNVYLDRAPLTVRPGVRQNLDLGKVYGAIRLLPPAHTALSAFDLRDPTGNQSYYGVSASDAHRTLYLLPRKYALYFSSDAHSYLAPSAVSVRAGVVTTVDLARLLGEVKVIPAPGTALTAVDIQDAGTRHSIGSMSPDDARKGVFLAPGRYSLGIGSTTDSYLDPAPLTVEAGSLRHLDLRAVYASILVPSVPRSASVFYKWYSPGSGSTQYVTAEAKRKRLFILPGRYDAEVVNGGNGRTFVMRVRAGTVTRLPSS